MKSLLSFLFLLFSVSLSFGQAKNSAPGSDLPNLTAVDISGTIVSFREMKGEFAIIYFNPSCDHCQHEAEFILAKKELFKNRQLYFVSAEEASSIIKFRTTYKLTDPNFHFSHANAADVFNAVGYFRAMPTIYLYRNQKNIGKLEGTVPAEDIANLFTVK